MFAILLGLVLPQSWADEADHRRAIVGLKVFTAFIAADLELTEKTSDDGRLTLLLLNRGDDLTTKSMATRLDTVEKIRGFPIRVEQLHIRDLGKYQGPEPTGIFIAEWLPDLDPILAYAEDHKALVFSPFLDDVGRGVHGGLSVTDRILPLIDMQAIDASGVRIKPFFLEVARHYEED